MSRRCRRSSRRRCSPARARPAGRRTSSSRSGSAGSFGRPRSTSARPTVALGRLMNLDEAAARADELAREPGNERELAQLRAAVGRRARGGGAELRLPGSRASPSARSPSSGSVQKLELLRRGLEDESAVVRGSAMISLTRSRADHPGDVNGYRPALNELAARDPNLAVRRLAIVCLRNGPPDRGTIQMLDSIAQTTTPTGTSARRHARWPAARQEGHAAK